MTKYAYDDLLEDDDLPAYREAGRPQRVRTAPRQPKVSRHDLLSTVMERGQTAQPNSLVLSPTLDATSQERGWIAEHLGMFAYDLLITSVLRRVKGGKEANVYCCAAHPSTSVEYVAAKLYRPRLLRNLRNDARYREGRPILGAGGAAVSHKNWRLHKAVAKKSSTGLEATQTSWLEYEYQTMQRLYAAGAAVPKPLKHNENAILMEYLGDGAQPAPPLSQAAVDPADAPRLFAEMLRNIELMLAQGVVHGDLSAYNVLYWQGRLTIIDFPQMVDPLNNPEAYAIFRRDVERICQFFEKLGVESQPGWLARDLWHRHVRAAR